MATARNTTGAKKTTKPRAPKKVVTPVRVEEEKFNEALQRGMEIMNEQTQEAPKLTQAKKGEFVETYKVPDGHNGIINPSANHLALGSAALTSGFTLQELHDLGADVDWLLETGQIVKDDIKIINQYQYWD